MVTGTSSKMDWELMRFPLDDPKWFGKAVVGGAIGMVGLIVLPLLFFVWGYGVRVMRQTLQGQSPTLPEWSDWRGLYRDGLRLNIVTVVYSLPAILLACPGLWLWLVAMRPSLDSNQPQAALAVGLAQLGIGFVLLSAAVIASFPLAYLGLVAHTRSVAEETLSEAFRFRIVWEVARKGVKQFGQAFVVWNVNLFVVTALVGLLSFTILLLCIYPLLIGILLTYTSLLTGAIFGWAYHALQNQEAAAST